jgi:hypothetical protein
MSKRSFKTNTPRATRSVDLRSSSRDLAIDPHRAVALSNLRVDLRAAARALGGESDNATALV